MTKENSFFIKVAKADALSIIVENPSVQRV